MSTVRITQIDGALPNLALMRLAHWHRAKGDDVHFSRSVSPTLFEPRYDVVYGSAIFNFSKAKLERFKLEWPNAIIGGTGSGSTLKVENIIGDSEAVDYTDYPDFKDSIGFSQRGCRLKCKFCAVPGKEGANRSVSAIAEIWRGLPYPRHLHLLDNDFFGQPQWRDRIREIIDGRFKVCISQGINVRLIDDEAAAALASIEFRDTKFQERRLYTAWDNLKDEGVFFRGVDRLERAGIKPSSLMAYMLVGWDKSETWARIWHRFHRMVDRGIHPYPMVFDRRRVDLICFQRWAVTGLYRVVPWPEYRRQTKSRASVEAFLEQQAAARQPGTVAVRPPVVRRVQPQPTCGHCGKPLNDAHRRYCNNRCYGLAVRQRRRDAVRLTRAAGTPGKPVLPVTAIDRIQSIVAGVYAVDDAHCRQAAMMLAHQITGYSTVVIGERFGNRDHTTVMHAIRVGRERLASGAPQWVDWVARYREAEALCRAAFETPAVEQAAICTGGSASDQDQRQPMPGGGS